jgi:hypothetical protein
MPDTKIILKSVNRIQLDNPIGFFDRNLEILSQPVYDEVSLTTDIIMKIDGLIVSPENETLHMAVPVEIHLKPDQAIYVLGRLLVALPPELLKTAGISVVIQKQDNQYEY